MDVATLILTWAENNLSFMNDEAGMVSIFLVGSTAGSLFLFLLELAVGCMLKRVPLDLNTRWVLHLGLTCVHLGFEDMFQVMVYFFVMTSHSASGLELHWVVPVASLQAAFFALVKILDMMGIFSTTVASEDRGDFGPVAPDAVGAASFD